MALQLVESSENIARSAALFGCMDRGLPRYAV